jgi:hypothetical protein
VFFRLLKVRQRGNGGGGSGGGGGGPVKQRRGGGVGAADLNVQTCGSGLAVEP